MSVLQSPLQNLLKGLSLQPLPKGPHEEVNDGIGTAVYPGKEKCNHDKILRDNRIKIIKPDQDKPIDSIGHATEEENQHCK